MQLRGEKKSRGAGFSRLSGPRAEAARQRQRRLGLGMAAAHAAAARAKSRRGPRRWRTEAPVEAMRGTSNMASRRRRCAGCSASLLFRAAAAAPGGRPPLPPGPVPQGAPPVPSRVRLVADHGHALRGASERQGRSRASTRCRSWTGARLVGRAAPRLVRPPLFVGWGEEEEWGGGEWEREGGEDPCQRIRRLDRGHARGERDVHRRGYAKNTGPIGRRPANRRAATVLGEQPPASVRALWSARNRAPPRRTLAS